ncbi:hypothetical protein CEXT_386381 [Caerostris extrusa]|uniref:Uncharacterized protein n=1 Tax=Caerostris extrusa TaxID=172846 RepID=A0AAV4W7L1_CAEEX|nr:hypothetical protein CEXT_386381 [Caerostris extrusa]
MSRSPYRDNGSVIAVPAMTCSGKTDQYKSGCHSYHVTKKLLKDVPGLALRFNLAVSGGYLSAREPFGEQDA